MRKSEATTMHVDPSGGVVLTVIAFQYGDPRFQVADQSGQGRNSGQPLAKLRQTWPSDECELIDPFVGASHYGGAPK